MDRQIVCLAVPSVEAAVAHLYDPRLSMRPIAIAPLGLGLAALIVLIFSLMGPV